MKYTIESGVDEYGQRFVSGSADSWPIITVRECRRWDSAVWQIDSAQALPVDLVQAEMMSRILTLVFDEVRRIDPEAFEEID